MDYETWGIAWAIITFFLSLGWSFFIPAYRAKAAEDLRIKEKLENQVAELKTEVEVLKKTSVTEVSLRDYISDRFRESDTVNKKELEKLEQKIDGLASVINEIARQMPKRKNESN